MESVRKGNLGALIYAHENGCEWGDTAAYAAYFGRIECLKYALENGAPFDECESVDSVEILEYLIQKKVPLTPAIYDHAVYQKNNRDVIDYLLKHTTLKTSLHVIAGSGDLELFKLAHEKKFPVEAELDENGEDIYDVYNQIIRSGSVDCLKYAIEKEIPMYHETLDLYFNLDEVFIYYGLDKRYEMMKWWLDNIPHQFCGQELLRLANATFMTGRIEFMELLVEKGAKIESVHLSAVMSRQDPSKLAYLLRRCGYETWDINDHTIFLPCFKYAFERGYSWPVEDLIELLSRTKDAAHCFPILRHKE